MRDQIPRRLTFANVVACLALFIALGGAAYAGTQLPRNSVGTEQLKKNAVNGSKVRNHSLTAADFGRGQLPAGPKGREGGQGREGPQGKVGAQGEEGARGGPGEFPETLPSGKTLRGIYSFAGHKTTGYSPNFAIVYQPPLAFQPTLNLVKEGEGPTAACPGGPNDPQAAPGSLCVYEARNDSATELNVLESETGGRLGALLFADVSENTNFEFDGSWAVTAP
ncbi:MAG TPA: hypothetical protein VG518_05875 [Solirubrobacterales bacterium]|nr:hypothetical protein [Solirubrobacterales bacterium]